MAWDSVRETSKGFETKNNLTRLAIESHHLNKSVKDQLGIKPITGRELLS